MFVRLYALVWETYVFPITNLYLLSTNKQRKSLRLSRKVFIYVRNVVTWCVLFSCQAMKNIRIGDEKYESMGYTNRNKRESFRYV